MIPFYSRINYFSLIFYLFIFFQGSLKSLSKIISLLYKNKLTDWIKTYDIYKSNWNLLCYLGWYKLNVFKTYIHTLIIYLNHRIVWYAKIMDINFINTIRHDNIIQPGWNYYKYNLILLCILNKRMKTTHQ